MRAILTYHSIDDSASVISTSPAEFRRQVEWLARSEVDVLPLDRILDRESTPGGPGHAVAITFDDAFANFADSAWPVLSGAGMPATVFVPAAHAGGVNAWENGGRLPKLPLMAWSVLARLAEAGVQLGSHSLTHADLTGLGDADLASELNGAVDRIRKETGREATTFAYPFGRVDDRVARAVRDRHALAVTTEFRGIGPDEDRARVPRLDAFYFRRPGILEQFGTGRFERFVTVRRRLRRARRLFSRD